MRPSPIFVVLVLAGAGIGLTQWVRSDLANRHASDRQAAWRAGPAVVDYDPKPVHLVRADGVRDVRLANPAEYFGVPQATKRHTARSAIWDIAATVLDLG